MNGSTKYKECYVNVCIFVYMCYRACVSRGMVVTVVEYLRLCKSLDGADVSGCSPFWK